MTENSDLQFDRAQFDGSAPKPECAVCATPLYSSYFEVNGQTVCEGCCYKLREATPIGSRPGRVLRATAAGIGAGLAGTVLYWAILAATGYEFAPDRNRGRVRGREGRALGIARPRWMGLSDAWRWG